MQAILYFDLQRVKRVFDFSTQLATQGYGRKERLKSAIR